MDNIIKEPNEEILKALDEIVDDHLEDTRRKTRKRSSILKQPKISDEEHGGATQNSRKSITSKRRVSFAEKFEVMEYCTGNMYDVPGEGVPSSYTASSEDLNSATKTNLTEKENTSIPISRCSLNKPSLSTEICNEGISKKHKIIHDENVEPMSKRISTDENDKNLISDHGRKILDFKNYLFGYDDEESGYENKGEMHTFKQDYNASTKGDMNLKYYVRGVPPDSVISEMLSQSEIGNFISSDHENIPWFAERKSTFNILDWKEQSKHIFSQSEEDKIELNPRDTFLKNNISKDISSVEILPISVYDVPLEENKENVFVDVRNKNILVTNARDLKLKGRKPLQTSHFPNFLPNEPQNSNNPLSANFQRHPMDSKHYSSVKERNDVRNEKSLADKTIMSHYSMELTCIPSSELSYLDESVHENSNIESVAENCFTDQHEKEDLGKSHIMELTYPLGNSYDCLSGSTNTGTDLVQKHLHVVDTDMKESPQKCIASQMEKSQLNKSHIMELTCNSQNSDCNISCSFLDDVGVKQNLDKSLSEIGKECSNTNESLNVDDMDMTCNPHNPLENMSISIKDGCNENSTLNQHIALSKKLDENLDKSEGANYFSRTKYFSSVGMDMTCHATSPSNSVVEPKRTGTFDYMRHCLSLNEMPPDDNSSRRSYSKNSTVLQDHDNKQLTSSCSPAVRFHDIQNTIKEYPQGDRTNKSALTFELNAQEKNVEETKSGKNLSRTKHFSSVGMELKCQTIDTENIKERKSAVASKKIQQCKSQSNTFAGNGCSYRRIYNSDSNVHQDYVMDSDKQFTSSYDPAVQSNDVENTTKEKPYNFTFDLLGSTLRTCLDDENDRTNKNSASALPFESSKKQEGNVERTDQVKNFCETKHFSSVGMELTCLTTVSENATEPKSDTASKKMRQCKSQSHLFPENDSSHRMINKSDSSIYPNYNRAERTKSSKNFSETKYFSSVGMDLTCHTSISDCDRASRNGRQCNTQSEMLDNNCSRKRVYDSDLTTHKNYGIVSDKFFPSSDIPSDQFDDIQNTARKNSYFTIDSTDSFSKPCLDDNDRRVDGNSTSIPTLQKTKYFSSKEMEMTCNTQDVEDFDMDITQDSVLISGKSEKLCNNESHIGEIDSSKHSLTSENYLFSGQFNKQDNLRSTNSVSNNQQCLVDKAVIHKDFQKCSSVTDTSFCKLPEILPPPDVENVEYLEKNEDLVADKDADQEESHHSIQHPHSSESDIVYAIKQVKGINQALSSDYNIFKFPEVYSSLKKNVRPKTSYSCSRIHLTKSVSDAIRQSSSFNFARPSLSLVPECSEEESYSKTNESNKVSKKQTLQSEESNTPALQNNVPELTRSTSRHKTIKKSLFIEYHQSPKQNAPVTDKDFNPSPDTIDCFRKSITAMDNMVPKIIISHVHEESVIENTVQVEDAFGDSDVFLKDVSISLIQNDDLTGDNTNFSLIKNADMSLHSSRSLKSGSFTQNSFRNALGSNNKPMLKKEKVADKSVEERSKELIKQNTRKEFCKTSSGEQTVTSGNHSLKGIELNTKKGNTVNSFSTYPSEINKEKSQGTFLKNNDSVMLDANVTSSKKQKICKTSATFDLVESETCNVGIQCSLNMSKEKVENMCSDVLIEEGTQDKSDEHCLKKDIHIENSVQSNRFLGNDISEEFISHPLECSKRQQFEEINVSSSKKQKSATVNVTADKTKTENFALNENSANDDKLKPSELEDENCVRLIPNQTNQTFVNQSLKTGNNMGKEDLSINEDSHNKTNIPLNLSEVQKGKENLPTISLTTSSTLEQQKRLLEDQMTDVVMEEKSSLSDRVENNIVNIPSKDSKEAKHKRVTFTAKQSEIEHNLSLDVAMKKKSLNEGNRNTEISKPFKSPGQPKDQHPLPVISSKVNENPKIVKESTSISTADTSEMDVDDLHSQNLSPRVIDMEDANEIQDTVSTESDKEKYFEEYINKLNVLRRKFKEASRKEAKKYSWDNLWSFKAPEWSFKEMDDEQAVFEILGFSVYACYVMLVDLEFISGEFCCTKISFKHKKIDPDQRDEIGFCLFQTLVSDENEAFPFPADQLLDRVSKYISFASRARLLIVDVFCAAVGSEISIDFSHSVPRLILSVLNRNHWSFNRLTFPVNVRSYPNEKIIPEIEHIDMDPIPSETILTAVNEVQPGDQYLRKMVTAVQDL